VVRLLRNDLPYPIWDHMFARYVLVPETKNAPNPWTFCHRSLVEAEQSKQEKDAEQRRDTLLVNLLKTPPQPRPKREREKSIRPKGKRPKKKTPPRSHNPHSTGELAGKVPLPQPVMARAKPGPYLQTYFRTGSEARRAEIPARGGKTPSQTPNPPLQAP